MTASSCWSVKQIPVSTAKDHELFELPAASRGTVTVFQRWSVILSLFVLNIVTVYWPDHGHGSWCGWKLKGWIFECRRRFLALSPTWIDCSIIQVYISYFFYKWTSTLLYLEMLGLIFTRNVQTLVSPMQVLPNQPDDRTINQADIVSRQSETISSVLQGI